MLVQMILRTRSATVWQKCCLNSMRRTGQSILRGSSAPTRMRSSSREAAGILNATIHRVDTREEREKALRETVIRVRENSINHKLANTFDVQEMAALAKEKNELPGTVHIPLEE